MRARLLDGLQHSGLVHSRRAARFVRIREEVHVRLIVLIGIAVAVEPARHAQPADLDAVGLDDDRLPGLSRRVARADEEQPLLAQMLARLGKSGPALIHHMVVGEGDDLDAVGLQRVDQRDRRVEHEGLGAVRVRRSHRSFQVDEAEVGALEDVGTSAKSAPQPAAPSPAAAAAARTGSCGITSPATAKLTCAKLVRIRSDGRGRMAGVRAEQQGCADGGDEEQRGAAARRQWLRIAATRREANPAPKRSRASEGPLSA